MPDPGISRSRRTHSSPRIAVIRRLWTMAALGVLAATSLACNNDSRSTPEAAVDNPEATTAHDREPDGGMEAKAGVNPDAVLRHAVFFKFKESSTADQIQEVVEAFKALPEKIDTISDFAWGTNNSPEGHDDGFTHCFLLTFHDEAGRAEYLPHEDHRAFGDILRPHMEDVFVVDYWGEAEEEIGDKLVHAVFFKFKADASEEDVTAIEKAFAQLPQQIDSIRGFEWGTNNSPENHDDGFTHCFLVLFDSEEGRAEYLPHEAHQAFVEELLPVLDQVRVLDFWAETP